VLGGATLLVGQSDPTPPVLPEGGTQEAPTDVADPAASAELRLREGMRLSDALGYFESTAEAPVFIDEEGRRLIGLENLNLQRVVGAVRAAEDPANLKWKVTGTITEYEGRNYILIERAIYSLSPR
jgi:hypothetical protein